MVYRGFTWNVSQGEARQLWELLSRYCVTRPEFMFSVDRAMALTIIARIEHFMEVTPDGSTSSHGPADA